MASEQLLVRLNMDARQYNTQARTAAANTGAIGASAKTTTRATGGLGQKMKGLASGGGGLVAVAGGAFAVKEAFEGTVGAFANFDDAMTQSLAIMGDVSDEMRTEMSDAAREVAKETTFSAEEAAEAYFFLASAGLDATQSVEAMPAVAQFAQAGMFDLATATDLATDAQSALGLASDDAEENLENLTRVTDVFTKANTLANTSVEQISEAMTTRAGAALRALNKDVEEGAAVLAALADQGVKGAEAGTQLGIVLRDLQTKALENKDAFQEAGVAVFNAEGNMRNIGDIIGDLEGRFDGMSDAQKRAELAALGFSDRSIAVLTTLLGTSDAIHEYEGELRDAAGTTEEVADKQLESLKNQFELLKSQVADVGLEIGEGLLPTFSNLVQAAGPVVEALGFIAQGYTDLQNATAGLEGQAEESGDAILGVAGRLSRFARQPALLVFFDLIKDAVDDSFGEIPPISDAAAASIEEAAASSGSSADEFEVSAGKVEEFGDELHDARTEALLARPDIGGLSGLLRNQGGKWDDVVTSMEEYEDMLRRLTDPVFAAIDDQQRLDQATQDYLDVIDDPDATVRDHEQAMLDLVKAQRDAEASAADLPEDMEVAGDSVELLGRRAGVTEDDLERLRDMIDSFEGRKSRAEIEIAIQRTGAPFNADFIVGAETGFDPGAQRHSGGPGRAGTPYRIRPDEEIFVPSGNGEFLLNNEVIDALKGLSSNTNTTTTNTYNIPVQSSGDANTDAQLVGSISSVLRRMETL